MQGVPEPFGRPSYECWRSRAQLHEWRSKRRSEAMPAKPISLTHFDHTKIAGDMTVSVAKNGYTKHTIKHSRLHHQHSKHCETCAFSHPRIIRRPCHTRHRTVPDHHSSCPINGTPQEASPGRSRSFISLCVHNVITISSVVAANEYVH